MQMKLHNKLLIATNNPGKISELRQLLAPLTGITLLTPQDIGLQVEVEETGETYRQNAALKARAYAAASGLVSLADDSGLEVDALDGAPGVHSHRYNGIPGSTYPQLRAYLVKQLNGKPRPWSARFRATIAIAIPDGELLYSEGTCKGEIIPQERGEHGFGYDPIFYLPAKGCTMAELPDAEKNAISHRGNAARAAIPLLRELFKTE
jgi:XTP/dITP diphosphohydrolase